MIRPEALTPQTPCAAKAVWKSSYALTKFMSHWIDSYKRKCKVTVGLTQQGFGDAAWARPNLGDRYLRAGRARE
jgi:hypothetical protein